MSLAAGSWVIASIGTAIAAPAVAYRLTGALQRVADPGQFVGTPLPQGRISIQAPDYYILNASSDGSFRLNLEAIGNQPVAAIEVAVNATQQLLAVGIPTPASIALADAAIAAAPAATSSTTSSPSAVATASVWTYTHGYFSTFWTDPLGITVNSVIDEARWYYNGVNVTSLTGADSRQWLSGNGWWEVSHSIGAYYNSNYTVGTVYTNDNFRTSSWFPLPTCGTTNTYYQANNAYGFADGHIGGGVNTWATGGCIFLLSYTAFASPGS